MKEFFGHNELDLSKYNKGLASIQDFMTRKGGKKDLIMFLSGMGGTVKSEVIKAFIYFAKEISLYFGWNYNDDIIKVTALTGAAACEIPNGRTLHIQACLSYTNISQDKIDS